MATITISNVTKSYGTVQVIHGVSIEIPDGSFVTLVGPSGCGKSTLMRMVAGLEDLSGGEIRIDDKVVNDVMPKDRDVAMVFQNYALYPHMTVRKNMGFSLRMRREAPSLIAEKVKAAAGILGLSDLLDRYPRELSGGQRQRVAMGRAIVRDPKVFLFDEPLSNLDAKLRVQMRTEIKELHQRLKTTTIYVTHDQIEAMTMADCIVVMRDGLVEQEGTPLELYDRPCNMFVASFIGSPAMNFLPGRIENRHLVLGDATMLPLSQCKADLNDREVVCGFRPEHLRVGGSNGIAARVGVVEQTGADTQMLAHVGNEKIIALFRERVEVIPGEDIRLSPDPDRLHLFDKQTGLSLI